MKWINNLKFFLPLFILAFAFMSCDTDENPVKSIEEAVERIPDFTPVPGGDNVTLKVNKNAKSGYFTIEASNIGENPFIENGKHVAWCILYDTPINSNNAEYNGVKLYSTRGDEKWKHVNYLLNKAPFLPLQINGVTWKEIQVAIWALADFREFNLDNIDITKLPGDFRQNDQPLFDINVVNEILSDVEANSSSFDYDKTGGQVILMETDGEVQNLITFTPGGWGSPPAGNNPGALLDANFGNVYPNDFVIGVGFTLTFTSAKAIENFLPDGGPAGMLSESLIDPTSSPAGIFGGHAVALKLNIDFNDEGLLGPTGLLGDLYFSDPDSPCFGLTIRELLGIIEEVLGGTPNPDYSINELLFCADRVNRSFGEGIFPSEYFSVDDPD